VYTGIIQHMHKGVYRNNSTHVQELVQEGKTPNLGDSAIALPLVFPTKHKSKRFL